ncbi:MAG TPA: polyhydroxyalkanoic acid system family protein [Rudaea sp.]|jgi:putative polyhydroxyalkanoate system protein|nr:polyhydroxyalkanoic acid system family protein [Rudaea sp.]
MASIDIRRPHGKTHAQARALVDKTADALGKKFGVASEWDGDTLNFHRSGVNGRIEVTASELIVHAELGFLLGAMKPMIEREIEAQLDKRLT